MPNITPPAFIRNGHTVTDCTLIVCKGNMYQPFHRRLIFIEEGEDKAVALALDADHEKLLQTEAPVLDQTKRGRRDAQFRAERLLDKALSEHFRPFREASRQADAERAARKEQQFLTTSERHVPGVAA